MLHHTLVASILLGACLIFGCRYAEAEETLKKIRENPNFLDEAMNSSMISDCNYVRDDFKRIIVSAIRILDFFDRHLDELVVDAAIGTRIMESQLKLFQAEHPNLPQKLQTLLMTMQSTCKHLSERLIIKLTSSKLESSERNRLNEGLYWVDDALLWESPDSGKWMSEKGANISVTNSTTEMESMETQEENMSEATSDKCTSGIFQRCSVTDECAKFFMENLYSKYSLTHQLFFFLFAKQKNCFENENFKKKMGGRDPTKFMHKMCKKIWKEANVIEESNFPTFYKDLFVEQITVCSLVGYTQFLKLSWLDTILSWQSDVDCYLEPYHLPTEKISGRSRRVKRSDNLVLMGEERCSVHFTTVALCSMAMHLRYFGDTCMKNY